MFSYKELFYLTSMIVPAPGALLVSDPFLKDPYFIRSVVFLCEHNPDGSFGFVLNRPFEQTLDEFIPDLKGYVIPVFYGGPVQSNTLHFLHDLPDIIPGGQQVAKGVYWGGDFEKVIELIRNGDLEIEKIRFFLGYSGWSSGQLDDEITEKSWLTSMGHAGLVFHPDAGEVWRDAIREMDDRFHPIMYYPIDPQLN
jgi:putative transcriptional regulator